jgi:predicted ATP-dependent endonuclease of OLD family
MPTTVEETEKIETVEDKKDELLLDSLEIKGYRCFEHLTIEKLGRVNLIVGKNNVGKTALLEALWIYANPDDPEILRKIVFDRNETTISENMSHESLKEYGVAYRNLFFNRPPLPHRNQGKRDSPYFFISQVTNNTDYLEEKFLNLDEITDRVEQAKTFDELFVEAASSKTTFVHYQHSFDFGSPQVSFFPRKNRDIANLFVSSSGINIDKQVEFWDSITLTPLEDDVINALHILLPELKRIDFIGYPSGSKNRVPIVRVSNEKERVPLKSFGEGMSRLLGISMALVQCQNGMLFIDEIENGLHYSVLLNVWRLIFKTARDLNVQVFAATHSSDCVSAFQRAAEEDKKADGMLIRLVRKGDKIKAVLFDENELEIAVENDIEVR